MVHRNLDVFKGDISRAGGGAIGSLDWSCLQSFLSRNQQRGEALLAATSNCLHCSHQVSMSHRISSLTHHTRKVLCMHSVRDPFFGTVDDTVGGRQSVRSFAVFRFCSHTYKCFPSADLTAVV